MSKNIFIVSLIFSFCIAFVPQKALAQFDRGSMSFEVIGNSQSLFPLDFYTIEIFNTPSVSESDFTIRFGFAGVLSGCAELSKGSAKQQVINNMIKVKVKDKRIRLNKPKNRGYKPRYTNFDCNTKTMEAFFDVDLNRDELIKDNIEILKLSRQRYAQLEQYEMDVSKEKLDFKIEDVFGNKTAFTFWFFPENTVTLHVPHARQDQDIKKELLAFAKSKGLKPIEDTLNGFVYPYDAAHYMLFTDPSNAIADRLWESDKHVHVGEISTGRTVYTTQGPTKEKISLDVVASFPRQPPMLGEKIDSDD